MRIWLWPIVIGLLSCIGLIVGLIFDGPGDFIAWSTLAIPVILSTWLGLRKRDNAA